MKVKFSPQLFAMSCGVLMFAQGLVAQTTTQLFGPVDVALSLESTGYGSSAYAFDTNTLNLTCPTSGIQAILSGPAASGGYLLVDNNIIVTVTPGGSTTPTPETPANVCPASGVTVSGQGLYNGNCFSGTYEGAAPGILGEDPDTYLLSNPGGVPPIDISSYLLTTGSPQSVTIALTDEGGEVASSSLFLTTNCTLGGVSSGTVSGNPITSNTGSQTQTFTFNSNTGSNTQPPQLVSFVYDVSQVNNAGNGAIPQTADAPLAQGDFQTKYAPLTSFATSNCLIHTGEVLTDGTTQACKLYTLECTDPSNGSKAGVNCPVSVVANEVVEDVFDGPAFSLQNIYTKGDTFHQGIGFLMASDDWSPTNGGPCAFDTTNNTPVASLPCPQNLLVSFSGPGAFSGKGLTDNPNSTFISIYGVPEDLTSIVVPGEWPDHWSNTSTPKVYFSSEAPNFSKGASIQSGKKLVPLPGAANFIPAPINSITYGISPAGSPLPLPVDEPIQNDQVLPNPLYTGGCPIPTPSSPGPNVQPNFTPPPVTLPYLADGQYLLHYYAQDCAGTQELLFTQDNTGSWSTNFYTRELNIDTTAPGVSAITLTPAGPYKPGTTVTASYSCSDATSGAGVVLCGTYIFGTETNYGTGTLKTKFIATGPMGSKSFTVYAVDGAGNTSSQSINYTVAAH